MNRQFNKLLGMVPGVSAKAGKVANEKTSEFTDAVENLYGKLRHSVWKPKTSDSARQLLQVTRDELLHIVACVLQISRKGAEKWADQFGRAIASKLVAAGATTSLLAAVATFGTAGTGTAIASLHGAAAASATLAWIGGLVGGGMLAGSLLTGGIGIAVGFASYKAFGSKARKFEELEAIDKRVVEACGGLAAAIGEGLDSGAFDDAPVEHMEAMHRKALIPLYQVLVENKGDICSRLDRKNAVAFRQHALKDFERNVIEGVAEFVSSKGSRLSRLSESYREYMIGGVTYALLSRSAVGSDEDSQLVLEAIRRSSTALHEASEAEITDYLSVMSSEQLKGFASNVKGIYHELAYVRHYNETNSDTYAELHEAINHPGADVQIKDRATDEVLKEIQLKATDNPGYVEEHMRRYPETEILVTEEGAYEAGVSSSGFRDEEVERKVAEESGALASNMELDQAAEAAGLAGLISLGRNAVDVLQGRKSMEESAVSVMESMTIASAATGIAAFLFS
jgi:hypothetical protein